MDAHPSRTGSFDNTDASLLLGMGGGLLPSTLQNTYSYLSQYGMQVPRSQPNSLLSQQSTAPSDQSTSFDIQQNRFSETSDSCGLMFYATIPTQDQLFEHTTCRMDNFARTSIERIKPRAPPMDFMFISDPQVYPPQSLVFDNASYLSGKHDTPYLPMEQSQSGSLPTRHFSWAQPDLPQHGQMLADFAGQSQHTPSRNLPVEVIGNANYQPGMAETTVGNMLGWIGRALTTGDRALPRLSTNLLAPPDRSHSNRSPSSASATGSSSSSRSRFPAVPGDLKCHSCTASFANQGDLTHHSRIHQPYASRNHVCHQCEKRFQYRKDLRRHLPMHDPHRQKYYCPFPNCKYHRKGFGRQDHLDRHVSSQHRLEASTDTTNLPPT